ncbi:MAG TPA: putative toxin-antitoxin system toxin component, PIN family, partial [Draconibacterium sp.]|nr:putative toxin-antitoxin system toxin component, PIN family [Draconibacterium sp.]
MKKVHRVIIDTNLWISFLITKQFLFLDQLFEFGKLQLLLSQELLDEFLEVTGRPKLKKYFETADVERLIEILIQNAEIIEVTSRVVQCRDLNDNFLLALARDGKAD